MNIHTYFLYATCGLALLPLLVLLYKKFNSFSSARSATACEVCILIYGTFIFSLIIYGKYIFGDVAFAYFDTGSDTIDQYVPYYLNLLKNIQQGTLGLWNAFFGVGTSFYSYQTWTLDPANLIWLPLCLIFGKAFLSPALVISQIIKLLISGLLFWNLSKRFCKTPLARICASIIYVFSGQMILWGQHYWMGTMSIMTLLMLNLLEASIENYSIKTYSALCLTSALSIICSTYNGYMILLFSAIYALLRVFATTSTTKESLILYAKLAVPVLCGVVISLITVIPYASSLLNESSRVGTNADGVSKLTYFEFIPFSWLLPVLSRFIGAAPLTTIGLFKEGIIPETVQFTTINSYEFIQLSLSACSIFLLAQLPFTFNNATKRSKVIIICSIALCLLYIFNYFLPALSNIFVDPKYRSSFYMDISLSIGIAWVLDYIFTGHKLNKYAAFSAIVITDVVLIFTFINTASSKYISVLYFLLFACFVVFFIASRKVVNIKPLLAKILTLSAIACMIISSVADAWFVTNWRQAVPETSFPYTASNTHSDVITADTQEAIAWLKSYDPTYFRMDKLYLIWSMSDGLISKYSCLTAYNSTADSDLTNFYMTVWPEVFDRSPSAVYLPSNWNKPSALRLLGEKYILSINDPNVNWLYPIKQFGSVTVYEIEGATGPLYTKQAYIGESQISQLPADDKLETLNNLAVVSDNVVPILNNVASTNNVYNVPDIGSNNQLADSAPEGSIKLPDVIYATSPTTFDGRITATADGQIGIFAIPYSTSFKVDIDDQEVDTFKVDYGLLGFALKAGQHTVHIRYEIPQLKAAMIASFTGLILSALGAIVLFRKRNQRR